VHGPHLEKPRVSKCNLLDVSRTVTHGRRLFDGDFDRALYVAVRVRGWASRATCETHARATCAFSKRQLVCVQTRIMLACFGWVCKGHVHRQQSMAVPGASGSNCQLH
jgi:hypothetical protein